MSLKLDLKYRPVRFRDVLGNVGVRNLLLVRSRKGSLADQSLMFGGPKGCGKTTLARIVAKALVCTSLDDGDPCGRCDQCTAVSDGTCPSVEELDAASQGTVDKMRAMVHDSDYLPMNGNSVRTYIIDEAQRLSKQAQDALLKSIEDRSVHVILCTTEPHKIQGPIRDRVEEYSVRPPTDAEVLGRLKSICEAEKIQYSQSALDVIVQMSSSPRSCILTLGSVAAIGEVSDASVRSLYRADSHQLVDLFLTFLDSDPRKALQALDKLSELESPGWIRDAVVSAIHSAVRASVGSPIPYPVKLNFFDARRAGWIDTAVSLGRLDRPTLQDVLVAIIQGAPDGVRAAPLQSPPPVPVFPTAPIDSFPPTGTKCSICGKPQYSTPSGASCVGEHGGADPASEPSPQLPPPAAEPAPPLPAAPPAPALPPSPPPPVTPAPAPPKTPPEAPKTAPAPSKKEPVEVDGVRFTADEALTTLDDKMIPPDNGAQKQEPVFASVELDTNRAPIPEKEFVSYFAKKRAGSRGSGEAV